MRILKYRFITAVLSLLTAQYCIVLCQDEVEDTTCYNEMGRATRCVSPRRSFSFEQRPQVNSTCGNPPTMFCSREVNILLNTISSDCNQTCDANDPANAHPAELMTDFILNDNSWWQSENSLDTQNTVVIDLALDTMVEISLISFDFVSIIPRAFQILKSVDFGETFVPFHFFATSCVDIYEIDPDRVLGLNNETSILCQEIPVPSTPGQITFFPTQHRPSSNDSVPGYSEDLYNFITATNIRVILDEHFPIENLAPDDLGYYYAVEDLNVVGSCQCYGHASSCERDPITGEYQCNCQHNTTGVYCERCADFYQDVPWSRADGNGFTECVACNCNNHSMSCVFDQDVYEQSGRTSGGVCLNCTHNTRGRNCERCAELFYPQPGLSPTDPEICAACDCVLAGVTNNGMCAQEADLNGVQPGDCSCKQNTQGRTCDQCASGFFNLSVANPIGCQECQCNLTGSVDSNCDQISGICTCKPNVVGNSCEECRFGFYLPDPESQRGCQPCNCNIGGSLSEQCDLYSGQCQCRPGVTGLTCSETVPGFFFPSIDFLLFEAEYAADISEQVIEISGENERFTGTGFFRATDGSSALNLGSFIPPVSGQYDIVLRYNLAGSITWESVTLSIEAELEGDTTQADCPGSIQELEGTVVFNYTSLMMGVGLTASNTACLRGGRSYTFQLEDFNSGQTSGLAELDIDSLVLILVDSQDLRVFDDVQLLADYASCVDSWRSLSGQALASPSCEQTTFAVSSAVYNGTLECDCDLTGTSSGAVCETFGGQCPCLPGVRGRQCDECRPSFFNLTSNGCTMCECDESLSQDPVCNAEGQCECLNNAVGRDCSLCAADHWLGLNPDEGCIPCSCNDIGSVSTQCDIQSGECLCKAGIQGEFCDSCLTQYYGFSGSGCRPCDCSADGSTNPNCRVDDGQCSCKAMVVGRDCSECTPGTFNLQQSNPNGCQPCFCSGQSVVCASAEGYVNSTIVTEFGTSSLNPLQGWLVINTTGSILSPLSLLQYTDDGIVVRQNSDAYFQSPSEFLGNMLSSYGQFMRVSYETNDTNTQTLLPYDVIISGNGVRLGATFPTNITGPGFATISLRLHEADGWIDIDTDIPASANDIQEVLFSLDDFLVTGSYDNDIILQSVSIDTAVPSPDALQNSNTVTWVEQCSCPANYTGLSCEDCAPGFTRTMFGTCELCQCNGLSNMCDQDTGECFNCTGSTTGRNCELCEEGTFGNPLEDIDCQPCPCPLSSGTGQFTNECVLLSNGAAMCLNCPQGHTGLRCETCLDGFFGDPTGSVTGVPTGCSDCLCSGNIDPNTPNSCDPVTGICNNCLNNTAGNQCERCANGFYGDAVIAKNCTACECNLDGSNGVCDASTGQCECHPNVVGRQCDLCRSGHFGLMSGNGCQPCNCQLGAIGIDCNDAGQCTCEAGVTGMTCNECLPGFFGYSSAGCLECSCSQINSDFQTCDANGQCICRPGSMGNECEQCVFNYYQTLQGCTACPTCYQELKEELNITNDVLEMNDRDIQTLLYLTSMGFTPFDSRILLEQQNIGNILQQSQMLGRKEDELESQYDELFVLINQTLVAQLVLTNASLDDLKGYSTTVFVLASTSVELVNYTIRDILQAREILNMIEIVVLPSVENSTSIIQNNLMDSTQSVDQLFSNVVLLTEQMDTLNNITYAITIISTTALSNIQQIQMAVNDTQYIIEEIQAMQALVERAISPLTDRLQNLSSQIMMTAFLIQGELDSLVSVHSTDQLNDILSDANTAESYAINITSEITNSRDDFIALNDTLTNSQQELENLQNRLTSLEQVIRNQLNISQNANSTAAEAKSFANSIIAEGELILENLRNFSNSSLHVAIQAAEALQAVNRITTSAEMALSTAEYIEERIGAFRNNVTTAENNANNARDITSRIQQDIQAIDTGGLLSTIQESLNSSMNSLQTATNLSSQVATLRNSAENQSSRIDQVEPSLELARNQTDHASRMRTQAVDSVEQLENMIDNLKATDEQTITSVEQLILNIADELVETDIENIYSALYSELQNQRARRLTLESQYTSIQPGLEHLRHLNSTLANLGCNV